MMLLKLAYRNLWRNKRRTIITIASVFFAVFFAVILRSMQIGVYERMIENVVGYYSGYIQVHKNGYWKEQTIDEVTPYSDSLLTWMESKDQIEQVLPRLEGFALAATNEVTKGALVNGIDPEREGSMLKLGEKMVSGSVFKASDKSVILGSGLAEYLKLSAGDTLVMLGQGYRGISARGKYPVAGIVKLSSPLLNDNLVFLPLAEAQWFYGAEGMITSYVLDMRYSDNVPKFARNMKAKMDTAQYEVMPWQEMMPELVQAIQADSAGGQIMLFILYMVITFGMFGTVLMMTAERKYEFGVLISIGMRRGQLALTVFFETVLISIIGVITGLIGALPIVYYFHLNPLQFGEEASSAMEEYGFEAVMPASLDPSIALTHAVIILIISILISWYPTYVLARLKPVEAMHV